MPKWICRFTDNNIYCFHVILHIVPFNSLYIQYENNDDTIIHPMPKKPIQKAKKCSFWVTMTESGLLNLS